MTKTEARQRVFDHVLTSLRKQGVASMSTTTGTCQYRDGRGNKCAVGHLIPDNVYDPAIEMALAALVRSAEGPLYANHPQALRVVESLEETWGMRVRGINAPDRYFLAMLQKVHDWDLKGKNLPTFERAMATVAEDYGLAYTPPEA